MTLLTIKMEKDDEIRMSHSGKNKNFAKQSQTKLFSIEKEKKNCCKITTKSTWGMVNVGLNQFSIASFLFIYSIVDTNCINVWFQIDFTRNLIIPCPSGWMFTVIIIILRIFYVLLRGFVLNVRSAISTCNDIFPEMSLIDIWFTNTT